MLGTRVQSQVMPKAAADRRSYTVPSRPTMLPLLLGARAYGRGGGRNSTAYQRRCLLAVPHCARRVHWCEQSHCDGRVCTPPHRALKIHLGPAVWGGEQTPALGGEQNPSVRSTSRRVINVTQHK